jgi:hypothetical protein
MTIVILVSGCGNAYPGRPMDLSGKLRRFHPENLVPLTQAFALRHLPLQPRAGQRNTMHAGARRSTFNAT